MSLYLSLYICSLENVSDDLAIEGIQSSKNSDSDGLVEAKMRKKKAAACREGARINEVRVVPSKANISVPSFHLPPNARRFFFPPTNPFNLPASYHPSEDSAHLLFSPPPPLGLISQQASPQKSRSKVLSQLHSLFFTHDERRVDGPRFDG